MKFTELRAQAGLRNDLPADRFSPGDMLTADNVEMDETGKVYRRLGMALTHAGAFHSLWGDEHDTYVVQSGWLCRFEPEGLVQILQVVGKRVTYQRVGDEVFWTDGVDSGVLRGQANRKWGVVAPGRPVVSLTHGAFRAGEYLLCVTHVRSDGIESGASEVQRLAVDDNQGLSVAFQPAPSEVFARRVYLSTWNGETPLLAAILPAASDTLTLSELPNLTVPVRTQYMAGPPPGQALAHFNGRLYVAENKYLWYSQPYENELFDRVGGYIVFSSAIKVLAPVSDGIFVGSEDETVFLSGADPSEFRRIRVAPYGAVLGTAREIPAHYFKDGSVPSPLWLWASERGVCMGATGGLFRDVTGGRYQLPPSVSGASLFKIRGGTPQFITSLFA